MQKRKITNSISVEIFDENDFLNNQKEIYDSLKKILNSFDFDENLAESKDYLDNLNGDIFLESKKVEIFVLKQNRTPVSFAILSNKKLDMIWTDFEYAKLGFATILLRAGVIELFEKHKFEFCAEIKNTNLIAKSLFESFAKVDGVVCEKQQKQNEINFKFNIEKIDTKKVMNDLIAFAI